MPCQKNRPDVNKNLGQEFNITLKGWKQPFWGQSYGRESLLSLGQRSLNLKPVTVFKSCDHGLGINCRITSSPCAEWECKCLLHTAIVRIKWKSKHKEETKHRRDWTAISFVLLYVKDSKLRGSTFILLYLLSAPFTLNCLSWNGKKWWGKQRQFCMLKSSCDADACTPHELNHASPDSFPYYYIY